MERTSRTAGTTPRRVLIVPRWGAREQDDWYPWIRAELAGSSSFAPVIVGDMPDPDEPTIAGWRARIAELAGSDVANLADTVLVGHSVGCQAVLHFLAGLPDSTRVAGTLCVAGWWSVDEPWESIRPWIEDSPDPRRVRASCGELRVLLSDDDPFTADITANARLWQERLGAAVEVVPGAGHFNRPEEPRVLVELLRWYSADSA
jgi:predicted alpha/beta hydrolase family esterase